MTDVGFLFRTVVTFMNGWRDDGEYGRWKKKDRRRSGKSGRMVERVGNRVVEFRTFRSISPECYAPSGLFEKTRAQNYLEQVCNRFLALPFFFLFFSFHSPFWPFIQTHFCQLHSFGNKMFLLFSPIRMKILLTLDPLSRSPHGTIKFARFLEPDIMCDRGAPWHMSLFFHLLLEHARVNRRDFNSFINIRHSS